MLVNLSNTNLLVTLPSGNRAVYSVQPQHVPREDVPGSREWPMLWGEQLAVQLSGRWYKTGGKEEITDPKTIALLERCPGVDHA